MPKGIAKLFQELFNPKRELISPLGKSQDYFNPIPSLSPTPTPKPRLATRPQPTVTPYPNMPSNPYRQLLEKYFRPEDVQKAENIMYLENRGFNPRMVHINTSPSISREIQDRNTWLQLRRQYPSIDVGLFQISTKPAMNRYLESVGRTYYEMMTNPELNIATAADLLYGRIPGTAPGWQNWMVNKQLNY